MAERYIVAGGAGFIGVNFVKHILSAHPDAEVLVVDVLTYASYPQALAADIEAGRTHLVQADIRDAERMRQLLAEFNPDFVVNFAAESHVDRSITGPSVFVSTNVMGAQTLMEECRRLWRLPEGGFVSGKRFLQISTDEVYGSLTRDFETPQPLECGVALKGVVGDRDDLQTFGREFFTESTPLNPCSPYSASKASADMLVAAYCHTYDFPGLITRCSNNYGPYQHPEKLIPLMVNNAREGKKLPVYGRGLNVRDWLYVGDHVCGIDMVLHNGTPGRVYNIGGFNEQANIDIVNKIVELVPRADATLIEFVTDRPGHDMRYAIDPTRIATELGWVPTVPFSRGLEMTVRHILEYGR